MLKDSDKEVIRTAALIAYQHHEKFNGQGYPLGLKAEDIDIRGRFCAIADVFDALGSDRVYKPAWEMDRIMELMKSERGQHFDPELVDIFFKELDKFVAIKDKFKD
jgi:response regulator RpfG family c-di-GMP phosphodiesterase